MEFLSTSNGRLPKLVLYLVLIFIFKIGIAQNNLPAFALASVDSLLQTTDLRPFNGKVLIVSNGKTLYEKTVGYANPLLKTKFGAHTPFVIGSVSKQITAVMVLQAFDKDLLDLQTPIRKYLPDLPMAWADTVTIHQLLNHTSGYQGRDKALAFLPGSRFSYSNQAYGLLGDILAKVHGKSFEELAEKLFRSCGMKHTTTPSKYKGKALPVGFSRLPDGKIAAESETYRGIPVPAGLILTTPSDLVRWNVLLHEQQKLLSQRSYQAMTTPSSRRPHPIFGDVDYGYGLQFTNVDGIYEISHGGYAPGFVAVNFYYPASKTSLIVMENLDWKDPAFKESYHFEMKIRRIVRRTQR